MSNENKQNRIANFFSKTWWKIKSWFRTSKTINQISKIIGLIFHYIGYIFWPIRWLKRQTYDKLRHDQQKVAVAILFLAPVVIGFIVFFLYPLIMSFIYSFSTVEIVPGNPIIHWGSAFTEAQKSSNDYTNPDRSTILFNYIYAFRGNADFIVQLGNTVKDTAINTVVITIFSLLMAVILNGNFRGRGLARAIFFLPVIFNSEAISSALEATNITGILDGNDNALSALFNLEQFLIQANMPKGIVTFLSGITTTITTTITNSGIQILIFLAAIQSVPKHLYEAAKIEGATQYESFWKITLPMVSPMILTVVVYTIIDSFIGSDINTVINTQSQNSDYGQHAAMSWIYLGTTVIMLLVFLGIISRWVFYYDDKK